MLHFISGDILLSKAQLIAHGVAPNDDFASGLAHSLRELAPAMYKDFRHYSKTTHPHTGTLWSWAGADGRYIVSLFTQQAPSTAGAHPGPADLSSLSHALKKLHAFILAEKITSVALPRIATGTGRLAWEDVKPVVQRILGDLKIPIFVYSKFHAGQAANEVGVQLVDTPATDVIHS